MTALDHRLLMMLALTVDFSRIVNIGPTPAGIRRIAPVTGGKFSGERLTGKVLPGGNDWIVHRPDSVMAIDVRLVLETDDAAMIYLSYQGRFLATPETMARFAAGALLSVDEYSLAISARFESGDERYAWLNNVVAVGTGEQTADGPLYSIFEVG